MIFILTIFVAVSVTLYTGMQKMFNIFYIQGKCISDRQHKYVSLKKKW